jgi:hypothetical protein
MIALSSGGRGLAMLVQQSLSENPFDGSVYAFRGPLRTDQADLA